MIETPDPRTLKRLKRAIRKRTRDQRAVLCAARFEDLGYEQTAGLTGLTVREVEELLAQALASITRDRDRALRRRWWRF